MIPKNELRTGNWVKRNNGANSRIIEGSQIDEAELLLPITLSDEVLLLCGFSFNDYFKLWQKARKLPQAGTELEMDMAYNVRDFGYRYIGVKLTSLHQLQNLFFMLRGTEMEMKAFEANNI